MDPVTELRRRVGKSNQAAVAAEAGVTRQYISMILKGTRDPGKKILDFLGIREKTVYQRSGEE
jgi:transcriptional regulator with XRE-family HTH domain